jgi:hypothetical protein
MLAFRIGFSVTPISSKSDSATAFEPFTKFILQCPFAITCAGTGEMIEWVLDLGLEETGAMKVL